MHNKGDVDNWTVNFVKPSEWSNVYKYKECIEQPI